MNIVNKASDPVEVYAGTHWQAGMIKSLLLDTEIAAFIQDMEHSGNQPPTLEL